MRVSFATAPNPGRVNEDFITASPDVVVVLDGAGVPSELDTGCVHGVPWFVQRLGVDLHSRAANQRAALTDCLADAIHQVSQLHGSACDLGNPLTPSATVAVARVQGESFEWLALADSTVLISGADGIEAVSDHRVSAVTTRQRLEMAAMVDAMQPQQRLHALVHAQRAVMNTADGYWAAATDPKAAEEALTGSVPLTSVRAAAILTDGAARAVDDFRTMTWHDVLGHLEADGPQGLIDRTRVLESADPDGRRWPRNKRHDDATAALLSF